MFANSDLVETLAASKIYQDYERAFSETTGLPVSLRPVETWRMAHRGKKHENRFCAMMAKRSRTCAACLRTQEKLTQCARDEAKSIVCDVGMTDTAVPVKLGGELIGFLQTGQVFRKKPSVSQFARVTKKLTEWGCELNKDVESAYFETRVLLPKQYEQMITLLTIFAQHLSLLSNQVLVQKENAEPPMITRAKQFIRDNQSEDLSLGQVAKAANMSTFYFCKMFKKATGLNFTEYLSRVRVEKAKNLLLNPNLRISEIAYEIGFQSLTHFNRVFKKVAGQSPTEYRLQLAVAA
jgi:AraC-like DNA-binding protein